MTTNAYIRGVKAQAWPPFPGRLWQCNYYERIIRDGNELEHLRHYIEGNFVPWETEKEEVDEQI